MKPTRPPNRPVPASSAKVGPIVKARAISANMTVEILVGEVTITITGPVARVVAVLQWLFGSKDPEAVIAKLQLVFGPEVSLRTK